MKLTRWALSLRNNPIVMDNIPLAAIIAAYFVAVYITHFFFGINNKIVWEIYFDWFTRLTILFSCLFILLHIRNRSYRKYFSPRYLAGFFSVFLLAPLYKSIFASFKQTIPLIHEFSWDPLLMNLDFVLHFGHHPWALLESLLNYPFIIQIIDFLYVFWFVLLVVSCLWMAWTKRRHLRLCFLISTLLIWSLLGSGLGAVFSSAGPCYYSRVTHADNDPFVPLMAKLQDIHKTKSLWAISNQDALWKAYAADDWLPFGGISAMPSIHLAMAMLFVLLAFKINKFWGTLFVIYLLVMQIGSVILGWHYAIDGYAAIILAWGIWHFVKQITSKFVT